MNRIEYRELLKIFSKELNWKEIVFNIAAEHPEIIIELLVEQEEVPFHVKQCILFIKHKEKIRALKCWREATGDTFQEAKAAIEKLTEENENNGI